MINSLYEFRTDCDLDPEVSEDGWQCDPHERSESIVNWLVQQLF